MIISVRTTPNSKKVYIEKLDDNSYKIKVDSAAVGGKANKRLVEILSDYFNISKSSIRIVKGEKSRDKIVDILKSDRNL